MNIYSRKTISSIQNMAQIIMPPPLDLTDEEYKIKEKATKSFYEFVKWGWPLIDSDPFHDNWHIEGMAEHLQAWIAKYFADLILNVPPRSGKTNICYVLLPAWGWIQDASHSFLCTAFSDDLCVGSSKRCRQLIGTKQFQRLFGDKVIMLRGRDSEIDIVKGGKLIAVSLAGSVLGKGGRFIMIDDPNNSATIYSKTRRRRENENVDQVGGSRTRGSNPSRLLTMQRLDVDDATNHVSRNHNEQGWVKFCLPEHYDSARACSTIILPGKKEVWKDPRTIEGELLDPVLRTEEWVEKRRLNLGSQKFESQYEQNPVLHEGNILDPDWFKIWKDPYPPFVYVLQSWDTALTENDMSAFSACTTWGVFQDKSMSHHVMLLDVYTDRLSLPKLRNKAIDLWRENDPDEILIEWKASGYSLVQELEMMGLPVRKFKPRTDKVSRCSSISGFVESGFVWIPSQKQDEDIPVKYGLKLLQAAQYFPVIGEAGDTADIIDSMSQALIYLADMYFLAHKPVMKRSKYRSEMMMGIMGDIKINIDRKN